MSGFVTQRRSDDCLRAALASLTGIPYDLLPDADLTQGNWVGGYNAALKDAGWPFYLLSLDRDTAATLPRWIAVVPSLIQNGTHAVVMQEDRLLHDVGRKATYRTVEKRQIKFGFAVVLTGDGWRSLRNPEWVPKELTGASGDALKGTKR